MPRFERPLETEHLRLLASPFDALSAEDQEHALNFAFGMGQEAAGLHRQVQKNGSIKLVGPEKWMLKASSRNYHRFFIRDALAQGVVDRISYDAWWEHLRGNPAHFDPRVLRFMAGWEVHGREIVEELRAIRARLDAAHPMTAEQL